MRIANSLRNAHPKRYLTMAFGTALVLMLWVGTRGKSKIQEDETGFVASTEKNQEDFSRSARSAITTMALNDNSDFFKPVVDAAKPNLIFHVGPIKAGVQALVEKDLPQLSAELDTDDYALVPAMDGMHDACQKVLIRAREAYQLKKKKAQTKSLAQVMAETPCWKDSVLDVLAKYKESKTSVIVADEKLSKQFLVDVEGIGPAVLDWITIRETIMVDFNIIVVLSYRRYYDWLPSAKAAAEQVHLVRHNSEPRLALWPGETSNGMLLEPLFPHFIKNDALQKIDVPYVPRLMDLYQPFVHAVKILNPYIPNQSVPTTFVCSVLEHATAACAASKALDAQQQDQIDTLSLTSRTALYDNEADGKWFRFQLYDELAVTAASHNYIRTKFVSRTTATKTTEYYVESYLNIKEPRAEKGGLPLACPSPNQLAHFLEQSLQFERSILPDFHAQHKVTAEREHRQQYNTVSATKVFCSIQMRKVLRQLEWRTFFRHLTETSAERIQNGGKPGPAAIHLPGGGGRTRNMKQQADKPDEGQRRQLLLA